MIFSREKLIDDVREARRAFRVSALEMKLACAMVERDGTTKNRMVRASVREQFERDVARLDHLEEIADTFGIEVTS